MLLGFAKRRLRSAVCVLKAGVRKTRPGFLVLGVHLQPLGLVEHLGLLQPLVVGNYGKFRDFRGASESKK